MNFEEMLKDFFDEKFYIRTERSDAFEVLCKKITENGILIGNCSKDTDLYEYALQHKDMYPKLVPSDVNPGKITLGGIGFHSNVPVITAKRFFMKMNFDAGLFACPEYDEEPETLYNQEEDGLPF